MRRILIFILIFLAIFFFGYAQEAGDTTRKIIFFYSPSCHRCIEVKNRLIPEIEKKFKGQIKIEYRDISHLENYKFLLSLEEKYRAEIKNAWPVLYFEGEFLQGDEYLKERLEKLIAVSLKNLPAGARPELPAVDLIARFRAIKPLALISAGLIDGVNPCAFTVIVFFISFLALQGYRKRELAIIGLSFIFSVFLTYLLIGIGFFGFFYQLVNFWRFARIFNLSVGTFSIMLGIASLYDFFKFKRTEQTEGMFLQLPAAIKNRIHSLIGLHYRIEKKEAQPRKNISGLFFSALVIGFLISILEAVCTGQVYLPAIAFVLKTTHLKMQALLYLLLYNLMFIMPLVVIFIFALWGVSSEEFSRFLKRHLLKVKILLALLFFGLGVFLIWRI